MRLDDYCRQFASLNRAPGRIFPESIRGKAPHKPLLLLAIMDMITRSEITSRFISVAGELTELNALFTAYWRRLMPATQTSSIAFPFARLHSEPFWELVPVPGHQITPAAINAAKTVSRLRKLALGANIDETLFIFMTRTESRARLAEVLLQKHFSDEGRQLLEAELDLQQQAFQYSLALEALAHKVAEPKIPVPDNAAVRKQGFRRAVVHCYDHGCALCGVRIVTSEGHTAVEAAHIRPWSEFRDDDVRNGMALCRLCHWAFDEGLMGVDKHYAVLLSPQLSISPNAAGFLMTLSGRAIIRPADAVLWPDPERLAWHRQHVCVEI